MAVMDVITNEGRARRTVVIDAYERDGTREEREVEPYSLRTGKGGQRLMFYCLDREATRGLLVANLIAARPTGRSFEPRWPVEL